MTGNVRVDYTAAGNAKDTAVLLLDAAEQLGHPMHVVQTHPGDNQFTVPSDVAKKAGLDKSDEPDHTGDNDAPVESETARAERATKTAEAIREEYATSSLDIVDGNQPDFSVGFNDPDAGSDDVVTSQQQKAADGKMAAEKPTAKKTTAKKATAKKTAKKAPAKKSTAKKAAAKKTAAKKS